MAFEDRSYSGNAVPAALTANITNVATAIPINASTGWPDGTSGPFHIGISPTSNHSDIVETIRCSGRTGLTLNVQTIPVSGRGWDGTTAAAHLTGSYVFHVVTATDLDEANQHIANTGLDHHCLSEDTEILTDEGWLGIDAVEEGVVAWTFNLETEQAEQESIQAVWRYSREEFPELIQLTNQDVGSFLLTPEHSVVWKRPHHGWRKRAAKTLPVQFFMPAAAKGHDDPFPLSDSLIALIAWCVTEGHWLPNGRITLAQKNGVLADRIRDLIVACGIPFTEYKQQGDMRAWRMYVSSLIYFVDENKVPRRELLKMSARQARLFLGECVLADGSAAGGDKVTKIDAWYKGNPIPACNIASINFQFLDWLQELAVLNGIKTRLYVDADGYCGRLALKQTVNHTGLRRSLVPNNGRVWCVTVENNGTLIARRPGSTPFIIGNSQYLTIVRHDLSARHGIANLPVGGSPSASQVGDTSQTGTSGTLTRSDHKHAREGFGSPVAASAVNADGAATTVSRSDHIHAGGVPILASAPSSPIIGQTYINSSDMLMVWDGTRWHRGVGLSNTGRTGGAIGRASATTIPDGGAAGTAIPWTAGSMTDGMIVVNGVNTTITPPSAAYGVYMLTVFGAWATLVAGRAYIDILFDSIYNYRVSTTDEDRFSNTAMIDFQGQSVQVTAWQNSGAARDLSFILLSMWRMQS